MQKGLTQLWYGGSGAGAVLQPLAWLYGAVTRARRRGYARGWLRSERVAKPVIVVGNLTVGGTGKTPLVIWLARELTERGFKVGIVSRGFGRRARDATPSTVDADSNWRDVGDEPLLIRQRTGCPTVVATDRVAAARALVTHDVDVIVADDGLQHLRLARDIEIVVIDGARGFGNGRLLPAGPLREAVQGIERADLVVVNGAAAHASLARLPPPRAPLVAMHLLPGEVHRIDELGAPFPLAQLAGRRVHAVAGIGNPARFFRELRAHGLEVLEHAFPDHHPFTKAELLYPADDLPILMTEKDAIRCRAFATSRMLYVPVTADLGPADRRVLIERVCAGIAVSARTR